MHQIIQLSDGLNAHVEVHEGGVLLTITKSVGVNEYEFARANMTSGKALVLSRSLLYAHAIKAGSEESLRAKAAERLLREAGEGAQGGHPQRMKLKQMADYVARYMAKGKQAGRVNWLALVALGALAGFWGAVGMAIMTAIDAGAVVL